MMEMDNTFRELTRAGIVTANLIADDAKNDFLSCELKNDTIYAAWGDVRTGKLNIYFTKTSINTGVGIQQLINPEDKPVIKVFPNPSQGNLNIVSENTGKQKIDISIYNTEGKRVYKTDLSEGETNKIINLTFLKSGIYMLKTESEGRLLREDKIILNQ